jgi:cytoskeletal protein RodZ
MQYLEALEKQDWDRLPSPVFIKGFIKTYTKALGLDYREVLGQFQSSIPVHDGLPKPLVPPKKINKRKYAILIALVILIVSLLVLFLVIDPLSHFKKAGSASIKTTEDKPVQNLVYQGETGQGQISIQDSSESSLSPETGLRTATKSETAASETKIQSPADEMAPQYTTAIKQVREITAKPIQIPSQGLDLEPVTGVNEKYALTGYVTQSTYVKIYVDNDPPREYIFSPGSYPQWRGNEGFYVLVGNAAGIEFDLNGKRIKDLGKQGDVVRLRLPENFNMNIIE